MILIRITAIILIMITLIKKITIQQIMMPIRTITTVIITLLIQQLTRMVYYRERMATGIIM